MPPPLRNNGPLIADGQLKAGIGKIANPYPSANRKAKILARFALTGSFKNYGVQAGGNSVIGQYGRLTEQTRDIETDLSLKIEG